MIVKFDNIDTDKWIELAIDYGLKLVGAIAVWVIGSWVIRILMKGLTRVMMKGKYDVSLQIFLKNLISWGLKIVLIIVVLGTVGVETTSLAAIIGAAGLAVGLALQGSLGNFAGGVLIMIFKPFKVGDLIEAQGEMGNVKQIEIFTTKLTGLSNKEIIIPNGALSNGNIINYTSEGTRRVDLVFGVAYSSDIKTAKNIIMNVLTSHPKVLKTPEPTVNVLALADSSVNFAVRPWCNADDYWDVHFEVTENVKEALDQAGIEIPFPHQVSIHRNV